MGYIYKVTNCINNKVYIGLTTLSVKRRWGQHKVECKRSDKYPNNKFYNALRKYGIENFTIEQIEEADNTILPQREQYWIKYYNSYYQGYNGDFGGSSGDAGEQVNQYDLSGHYIQTFQSASIAERTLKDDFITPTCGVIATAARLGHHSKTAYGYQWRYVKDVPKNQDIDHIPLTSKCAKPVDQYDLEGNYIASFSSLKDAAESVQGSATSIRYSCLKKVRQFKNYQWCFAWDEPPGPVKPGKKYSKFN